MADPLFIDSWGWLALEDSKDPDHEQVAQFYRAFRQKNGRALTTDYVLDETITLLFRRRPFTESRRFVEGLLAAVASGYLIVQRITSQRFAKAWQLRSRYNDKPDISFTDLTSFVVMEEEQVTDVLTNDHHFIQVNLGFTAVPST